MMHGKFIHMCCVNSLISHITKKTGHEHMWKNLFEVIGVYLQHSCMKIAIFFKYNTVHISQAGSGGEDPEYQVATYLDKI